MKNPIERIAEKLIGTDSQKAIMVYSERNRRYFTGFPSDAGALLITAGEAYLLQDFRYEEAASYSAKNCTVVGFTDFKEKLCELLEKHGAKQVYMEVNKLSVADARIFEKLFQEHGMEAVLDDTLDKAIKDQRMIKSPGRSRRLRTPRPLQTRPSSTSCPLSRRASLSGSWPWKSNSLCAITGLRPWPLT